MSYDECLSILHALNVMIKAYNEGFEHNGMKVDLVKVETKLYEVRKELEKFRRNN